MSSKSVARLAHHRLHSCPSCDDVRAVLADRIVRLEFTPIAEMGLDQKCGEIQLEGSETALDSFFPTARLTPKQCSATLAKIPNALAQETFDHPKRQLPMRRDLVEAAPIS